MKICIFGNQDIHADSLPLRILPALKDRFPDIEFQMLDPNEEWDIPADFIAIDTVENISSVTLFTDIGMFERSPRITMHDFDALSNIRLLYKIGKIKTIRIIGVPPDMREDEARDAVTRAIGGIVIV